MVYLTAHPPHCLYVYILVFMFGSIQNLSSYIANLLLKHIHVLLIMNVCKEMKVKVP